MNFTTAKIAVDKFINEIIKNKVEEAQIISCRDDYNIKASNHQITCLTNLLYNYF